MKRKVIGMILVIAVSTQLFSGCSRLFSKNGEAECPYEDFIVVDVFDALANMQGIQSGWFAKIVKDKFNMELNIIAPNATGCSDTLFDIRTASGTVGDIIICGTEDGDLQKLVDEGLILDMSDMLAGKPIMQYQGAIESLNEKLTQDGIFAIPSEISGLPATQPSEGLELTYGPYLRWDVYAAIGYPDMSTLEDLLPVLDQMRQELPNTEAGNKTYGFSFFRDWDGNLMNAAKQPACFYGYDEFGFVLARADGSDYQSIIDKDSLYMRNIRLYYNANQLGLVDPDSSTQSYMEMSEKYKDGSILYAPWPWLCQSEFNTIENKSRGKGYMLAPIDDMQIFSYGCNTRGNQKTVIGIGSQAEDPQRMADFIDWLYSPEGIQIACAQQSDGTAGPKGLTWEMGDKGPYLTDFGRKALLGNNTKVPGEWGGGTWEDGVSQLNFKVISQNDLDPDGYPYYYNLWSSYLTMDDTPLDLDWRTHLNTDAGTTRGYLEENDQIIVAPGSDYILPPATSDILAIRSQCRSVIVDYSWKMIFAKNNEYYQALYEEMLNKVHAFGYDKVYAEDLKNAGEQDKAREEAAALSAK